MTHPLENKWFGAEPFAPICSMVEHAETPVGEACSWCEEPIAAGESGLLIVHLDNGGARLRPFHEECQARTIIGSIAHIEGRCGCFGGTDDGPPEGMTKREEARRAVAAFRFQVGRSKR